MFCSKCGNECRNTDVFCSSCGNRINDNITENTPYTSKQKNPMVIPLLGSLLAQTICLVCAFGGGTFGGIMAIMFFILIFVILILSIFCIVKSKNVEKKKGKPLGIVFTVLSSLLIVIILLALITNTDNMNTQVNNTASEAVEVLKDHLKSPSSLYLNSVIVEVKSSKTEIIIDGQKQNKDEPFDGSFTVYIDFSADNSLGGATRSYFEVVYYVVGTNKTLIRASKIESIPQLIGTVYEVDVDALR